MSSAAPTAEQLAIWAAEQLWDWRVRLLFGIVCVVAAVIALFVYLKWARGRDSDSASRARVYLGRISVTLLVIMFAEHYFFKEPVSSVLLLITALVIGLVGLRLPKGDQQ